MPLFAGTPQGSAWTAAPPAPPSLGKSLRRILTLSPHERFSVSLTEQMKK